MPRLSVYTAERRPIGAPSHDFGGAQRAIDAQAHALAQTAENVGKAALSVGGLVARIQGQRDERQAEERIQLWQIEEARIRQRLLQPDPTFADAVLPNWFDVEGL